MGTRRGTRRGVVRRGRCREGRGCAKNSKQRKFCVLGARGREQLNRGQGAEMTACDV